MGQLAGRSMLNCGLNGVDSFYDMFVHLTTFAGQKVCIYNKP